MKPGRDNEFIGIRRIDILRLSITGTARNKLLKNALGLIQMGILNALNSELTESRAVTE